MKTSYDETVFRGILLDPGCSVLSTGGTQQYQAYCRFIGQAISIDEKNKHQSYLAMSGIVHSGLRTYGSLLAPDTYRS